MVSKYDECLRKLLFEAEQKGYLTFDNIMDTTDIFDLSLSEVERISEMLSSKGVIIYEKEPLSQRKDKLDDFSHIDYNLIFNEIIEYSQELNYLVKSIKKIPAPQYKEITILTNQNLNGNKYARERLILSHLRLVLKIALSMSKQYELDLIDAISSGFKGLIVAVDKYNPNGFSTFQSYASLWIQQHIQRECNPKWFEFYFSAQYKEKIIMLKEKYEESYGSIEFGMDEDDMILFTKHMSLESNEEDNEIFQCLCRIKNQKCNHLYLDEFINLEDIDDLLFQSGNIYDLDEMLNKLLLKDEIKFMLQGLTEREEKVIKLRYGLEDDKEHTLEEIGKEFNVTRERIRQIEAKALKKLRKPKNLTRLKFFL